MKVVIKHNIKTNELYIIPWYENRPMPPIVENTTLPSKTRKKKNAKKKRGAI